MSVGKLWGTDMTGYTHYVSGIFVKGEGAQIALSKLNNRGIPNGQLSIYDNSTDANQRSPGINSNGVLKDMIVDGAVGAAVGTGIGVLAEVALAVADVSLFIASPLLAPLAMLGWGASLGGVVGAVVGSERTAKTDGTLADLVHDAVMNGQVILVAKTLNEAETSIAQDVIKESVGEFNDLGSL
jgi:hypothetical protein